MRTYPESPHNERESVTKTLCLTYHVNDLDEDRLAEGDINEGKEEI